jgi:hypothetical protein
MTVLDAGNVTTKKASSLFNTDKTSPCDPALYPNSTLPVRSRVASAWIPCTPRNMAPSTSSVTPFAARAPPSSFVLHLFRRCASSSPPTRNSKLSPSNGSRWPSSYANSKCKKRARRPPHRSVPRGLKPSPSKRKRPNPSHLMFSRIRIGSPAFFSHFCRKESLKLGMK